MALSLTAEQKSIMALFETSERYVIPNFQRAYSWEYNQCFQLYTDITTAFNRKEDYFLGNLLIARSLEELKQPIVIDGQQRLITIWIILKVLSLLMPEYTTLPKLLRVNLSLRNEKLETKVFSQVPEVPDADSILRVDGLDEESVKELPNLLSKKSDVPPVIANCALFYQWFRDYQSKDGEGLASFCDYLLEHVYLLPIEIGGGSMVDATNRTLTIFETLNNRGLSLEDADIFKSRLYAKAQTLKQSKQFMEQWVELNESCNRLQVSLDDVFRYYSHVIRGRKGITTSEISLRDFFINSENAPLVVVNYDEIMRDLQKIVNILDYLSDARQVKDKVSVWLQILDAYTNVYPWYAVVVYLYVNGTTKKAQFVDFLQNLVRYCYHYGSSTSVKFGIYTIIKIVSYTSMYQIIYPETKESDFEYLGRLRNGLVLLNHYLQNQDIVLLSYHISKIYKHSMNLEEQGDWRYADWDKVDSLIVNYKLSGQQQLRSDKTDDGAKVMPLDSHISPMSYAALCEENLSALKYLVGFFKGELQYE